MPRDLHDSPGLRVSVRAATKAGPKPVNQDFHGAIVPTGGQLALKGVALAIADGISSSPVGGEAAETAVASFLSDYYATPDSWSARTSGTRVIAAVNGWLHGRNAGLDDIDAGHVCVFAALVLKGAEAHLFHIGDSRIWRLAGGRLEQLTEDHRIVLSGESHLSRALGAAATADIAYRCVPVAQGDVFVMTTDGVHGHLAPQAIAQGLSGLPDAAAALVDAALAAGSEDNVTAQVVRVDALPDAGAMVAPADLPLAGGLAPGVSLDGFLIRREIHASARSRAFLATDAEGRRFFLKVPSAEIAADPDARRRFAMEEWIARRVTSPHVVAPAPAGPRSALYVVTEFVEGTTLRQWMTDNPRPALDAVRAIAEQLVRGLRALHRREMVHQDLRPENVMIDAEGVVKIIDLGSASVAGVEEAAPGLLGALPGTFQYTAPEYLSGDVVSWRSDQYALAAIVYEMLTGRLPYGAEVARIRSRADQRRLTYRPARDEYSPVPAWMDGALRRALHPDPSRRYDALSEFLADLRRPAPGAVAGHVPLAQRNPVRFWQAVSALLALACLILAAQLT